MKTSTLFFRFQLFVVLNLFAMAGLLGCVGSLFVLIDSHSLHFGESLSFISLITKFIALFVVPYCAPFVLLVGIPAFFLFNKSKMLRLRKWLATLSVLAGSGAALACYPTVEQCELSTYARNKILSTLTDKEKPSLKGFSGLVGSDEFCSVNFAYTKDDKRLESFVVQDIIHGPKIFTEAVGN